MPRCQHLRAMEYVGDTNRSSVSKGANPSGRENSVTPELRCLRIAGTGLVQDFMLGLRTPNRVSSDAGSVSGNINAAVVAVAERACDLILGREPLPADAGHTGRKRSFRR